MNKVIAFIILISLSCSSVYALRMPHVSEQKQKNMREFVYDTNDTNNVLNAAVTTLQDSDFVIEEYNKELGFIRASKTFKAPYVSKKRVAGWGTLFALATAYTVFSYGATAYTMYEPSRRVANEMRDKTIVVNTNVFVEQINDTQTRVHFLPVAKVLQNADGFSFMQAAPIRVFRMYKPDIYNEFFSQVNENLY